MYKKFVEAMVERAVSEHFNITCFKVEAKYLQDTEMVHFKIRGLEKGTHDYFNCEGYVGTIGQIVIDSINFKTLEPEEFITINK